MGIILPSRDVFLGSLPDLTQLFQMTNKVAWLSSLSQLMAATQAEPLIQNQADRFLTSCFSPDEIERMDGYAKRHKSKVARVEPFSCMLAAQCAAVIAPSIGPSPSPRILLQMAVRAAYVVSDLLNQSYRKEGFELYGALAGLMERSAISRPIDSVRRSYGLWEWSHEDVTAKTVQYRKLFGDALLASDSLSLADLVNGIGLLIWLLVVESNRGQMAFSTSIQLPRADLTAAGNSLLLAVLSKVASPLDQFVNYCVQASDSGAFWKNPTLLPLKNSPAVQVPLPDNSFGILAPTFLADHAVQRPLRVVENSDIGFQTARGHFGSVAETYAHGLLRSHFNRAYHRIDLKGHADGVAVMRDMALVFEMKNTFVVESKRYGFRTDEEYLKELQNKHYLSKAQEQIWNTIDWLPTQSFAASVKMIVPVVVLWDTVTNVFVAKKFLAPHLRRPEQRGPYFVHHPQVYSLTDLEELGAWWPLNLRNELLAKVTDDDWTFDGLSLWLAWRRFNKLAATPTFRTFDSHLVKRFENQLVG